MPAQKTRGRRALGKKPRPAKRSSDGGKRGEAAERLADLFGRLQRNFADEFQGDVRALEAHPARAQTGFREPRAQFGQLLANLLGNVEGDEEAHVFIPHLSSAPRRARRACRGERR